VRVARSRAGLATVLAVVLASAACATSASPDSGEVPSSAAGPLTQVMPTMAAVTDSVRHTPVPTLAWGPTVVEAARQRSQAASLPLEQAAGMVLIASWNSPDAAGAANLVATEHLAGLVLMGDAMVDRDQVTALTTAITEAGARDSRWWPTIVSTDQEGGTVARLRGLGPDLPAFMAAGSATDLTSVREAYAAQARDMRALGFTVNWAPDADVTAGASDAAVGVRSAGTDPQRVAATVVEAVTGFSEGGIVPAIKHYPGHGSVSTDSHQGLPVQDAPVSTLAQRDLVPFALAIDAGVPIIMTGHIAVSEWGSEPATLNPAAYNYLRDTLKFTGVVVTDAMNMGAITNGHDPQQSVVDALASGADLIMMPVDPAAARQAIIDAVNSGQLDRGRLDEAVGRVALLMQWQEHVASEATAPTTDDADYARRAAGQWATVSTPTCGVPLVGASVTIRGGWPAERDILASALAEHGIATGGGTSITLIGAAGGSANADVVVALDAPWGLPTSTATTYIGLYGRSGDALRALADVLAGTVDARGSWAFDGMPAACGDSS